MDINQSAESYLSQFPGVNVASGVPTPEAMQAAMGALAELGKTSDMPADGKLTHLNLLVAALAEPAAASAAIFNREIVDNPGQQQLAKVLETALTVLEKQSPETWKHVLNHTALTMQYHERQYVMEHPSATSMPADTQIESLTLLLGALCHDMGKAAIDPQLLHKSSRIDRERMQSVTQKYDSVVPDYPEKRHDLIFMEEANSGKILFADKGAENTAAGVVLDIGKDFTRSETSLTDVAAQQQHNAIWNRIQQKATEHIVPADPAAWLNATESATLTLPKRGTLTDAEKAVVESHDSMSELFVKAAPLPEALRGVEKIVSMARFRDANRSAASPDDKLAEVIHVTDVLEALTADRSYRSSFQPAQAMHILKSEAAQGKLDPTIVQNLEANGTLAEFQRTYEQQHPNTAPDNPPKPSQSAQDLTRWLNSLVDNVTSWVSRMGFADGPKNWAAAQTSEPFRPAFR